MTEYDVRLEGLTKRFDDVIAVDDVNIDIEPGEFLTLLGPSGCGKTTTLRCVAGLEEPTEGTVYIDGEPVNNVPPFERDTGMVFQSYALFPHMTVGENVAFGLQMLGEDGTSGGGESRSLGSQVQRLIRRETSEEIDARVAEMLELVELPDMMDRSIDQLSGGQQQRVALARSLITEPTVLLLDEPLGALDLQLRKNMQIELQTLQSELETTFIYVTHDQEEALTMSDKIVVMNSGRVEQIGKAEEIYEQPETQFVADFIGETNLVHGTYEEQGDTAYVTSGDLSFEVLPQEGLPSEIAFAVRPEKIRLGDAAERLDNTFQGEVIDEIYKGNLGKFIVRLPNGIELTVDVQHSDRSRELGTDQTVPVGWSARNTVLLPE